MKSHEVLRLAIDDVGTKKVAADLRVSSSLVYKWCQPPEAHRGIDASGARNPLDRLLELCRSADSRLPVEWLCGEVGGYFVPNPEAVSDTPDAECLEHTRALLARFSSLLQVISDSIANESRIDAAEAASIRRVWRELLSQGEAFVTGCEQGRFDPTRG